MLHFPAVFSVCRMSLLCPPQHQGVGIIILVTIVTSFMLVYNSSGDRSSLPASHQTAEPVVSEKQPKEAPTLEGYFSVADHKVNEHHLFIQLALYKYKLNLLPLPGKQVQECEWALEWNKWVLVSNWENYRRFSVKSDSSVDTQHYSVVFLCSFTHSPCNYDARNSWPLVAALKALHPTRCT